MQVLRCFMAMAFLLSTAVAVPVEQVSHHHHQQNLTNHSLTNHSHSNQTQPLPLQDHQRLLLSILHRKKNKRPPPSPPRPPPPSQKIKIPSSPPLPPQTPVVTRHSSASKVEDYAKKLRDDLDKQEKILTSYIVTIRSRHEKVEIKLTSVNKILNGLKEEIANATRVANVYQVEQQKEQKEADQMRSEYNKSFKMYQDEQDTIKFEKQFLEEIITYIKLRKNLKC